jgi:hypothetical protein
MSASTPAKLEDIRILCNELETQRAAQTNSEILTNPSLKSKLHDVAKLHGLQNDEPTQALINVLSQSVDNGNKSNIDRLKSYVKVISAIKNLLTAIAREEKKFKQLSLKAHDLLNEFTITILEIQQLAGSMIGKLKHNQTYLQTIEKLLEVTVQQDGSTARELVKNEKDAVIMSLDGIITHTQEFQHRAGAYKEKLQKLRRDMSSIKSDVCNLQSTVQTRTHYGKAVGFGCAAGAVAGVAGTGTIVALPILGGAGALVITGLTIPPWGAILAVGFASLAIIGGVAALIEWARLKFSDHQLRAQGFLTQLNECLDGMVEQTLEIQQDLNQSVTGSENLKDNIEIIRRSLQNPSFYSVNREICAKTRESTSSLIESLETILKLNPIEWKKPYLTSNN